MDGQRDGTKNPHADQAGRSDWVKRKKGNMRADRGGGGDIGRVVRSVRTRTRADPNSSLIP